MSNEQDLAKSPNPSRIKYLRRITSAAPLHYEAILGAYGRAPQMLGEDIVVASKHIGDSGNTEVVNIPLPNPLPDWLENSREPIKRNNELLLVRPEQEEAILVVGPESNSSPAVIVEELLSRPQPKGINPPYPSQWQAENPTSQHDTDLASNRFLQPLKKAA